MGHRWVYFKPLDCNNFTCDIIFTLVTNEGWVHHIQALVDAKLFSTFHTKQQSFWFILRFNNWFTSHELMIHLLTEHIPLTHIDEMTRDTEETENTLPSTWLGILDGFSVGTPKVIETKNQAHPSFITPQCYWLIG